MREIWSFAKKVAWTFIALIVVIIVLLTVNAVLGVQLIAHN